MLYELVMKDFVLIKKYLVFLILVATGFPALFSFQNDIVTNGPFIFFIVEIIVVQFVAFSAASTIEYKSRGSILLCATPYTRKSQIQAKYIFNLITFIFCYIAYSANALLSPGKVIPFSISDIGYSLMLSSIFYGIYIPAQYKFGIEKIRVIFQLSAVAFPFILTFIAKFFKENNITLDITIAPILQDVLPYVVSAVVVYISMALSIRIYSKQDL